MIVALIVKPASKLATARGLDGETFFSSLWEVLGLERADEDELYLAMNFLLERQG
ncbi:Mobile element protein [Richelia intracellularis]|nr:Mobile element protein [Richelia intracellularis]